MSWECFRFQVDVKAGYGNEACYLATPKVGGCPTHEVSLLQFWVDRMIHTARQSRLNNFGKAAPVRVKHFISCSYKDLVLLQQNLGNITTESYTEQLANKTHGYGDCCMMSKSEWGHAKMDTNAWINLMAKITWIMLERSFLQ